MKNSSVYTWDFSTSEALCTGSLNNQKKIPLCFLKLLKFDYLFFTPPFIAIDYRTILLYQTAYKVKGSINLKKQLRNGKKITKIEILGKQGKMVYF